MAEIQKKKKTKFAHYRCVGFLHLQFHIIAPNMKFDNFSS